MTLDIVRATTSTELAHVRDLMRAFVDWHRSRHVADLALIDSYFDAATFEAELAGLPGKYDAPDGALLLAYHRGAPAGCVALRNLGDGAAEMKRMFVPDAYRGLRIGRSLAERIMSEAMRIGYRTLRLDTSHRQAEAIGLYESLGFRRVPPYYEVAPALADWLVFFERGMA